MTNRARIAVRSLRPMARTAVIGVLLLCIAPSAAVAAAIPGATYVGTIKPEGTIRFTVSADATIINSYSVSGVQGRYLKGSGECDFVAAGKAGDWEGAPVLANAFSYSLGPDNLFQGTFSGGQTARGTIRLYDPPTPATHACDTGTLSWTATTTATAPAQPGGAGGNHTRSYGTTLSLQRSSGEFTGSVSSASKLCRPGRTVTIWIGPRSSGRIHVSAGGTFRFGQTAAMRGLPVRVAVGMRKLAGATCGAASSRFVDG